MEGKIIALRDKLENDGALGQRVFLLETPEEVQSLLKEDGLEFTIDEIMILREALMRALEKKENGELSDDDLEEVAGGFIGILIGLVIASIVAASAGTEFATGGKW
jgi:predicted ribosomally synthesized peptide with nif11-like leader